MTVLKRVEVWILLALVVGGLVFVLATRGDRPGRPGRDGDGTDPAEAPAGFTVTRVELRRDGSHAMAALRVRCRNDGDDPLVVAGENGARLVADGNERVPVYFRAFAAAPEVAPGEESEVVLRYWLSAGHLEGALRLELGGESAEVKDDEPLALDALEDGEEIAFTGTRWRGGNP